MGHIPVSEIRRYADRFGFDGRVREYVVSVLRAMDCRYLEHVQSERERERSKELAEHRRARGHG